MTARWAQLPEHLSRSVSRRDLVVLSAVLLLAVVLRVAWVIHSETVPAEGVDSYWYNSVAKSFALGHGIANPEDGTTPTALFPPGYPFVLGLAYKLLGAELWVAQALNIVVSLMTIAVTYIIGRLVFGQMAAGVGAALLAIFPSQVIYSSLVMSDLLFTLLFAVVVLLLLLATRASPGATLLLMLGAGLLAGASALVRGQGVVLLGVVPVWWLLVHGRQFRIVPVAVFVYAMFLAILPWTFRNWQQLDSPVFVSTNMGWNAAIGHNEAADGGWMFPGWFFVNTLEYPYPKREVEFNRQGTEMAWEYVRSHPVREIELSAKKAYRLWSTDADAVVYQELNVPPYLGSTERGLLKGASKAVYFAVLGLSAIGLVAAEPRVRGWRLLLLLLVAGWTVFHFLIFGEGRFHYPLSPLFSLAAGAGLLVIVTGSLKERREMVRRAFRSAAGLSRARRARADVQ